MPTLSHSRRSERGTVLIVALLLAAIIGVSLVSYLKLANNSLKQANRSFYANSGMNIAEIGLEQAIAAFNQLDNGTVAAAWTGWTTDSTAYNASSSPTTPSATRTFTGFTMGPNATGSIKVYVQHYTGATGYTPLIVAKASITQPEGGTIDKYIEVTLRKRSLFSNGLVAKDNVTWSGHPSAASWNSDPDNNPATPFVPYSSAVMTANVTVGSLRGSIGLAGGEVWGFAKTGPTGSISGGSVHGLSSTTDDASRRTNDFNATFPTITTPSPSTYNTITSDVKTSTTFPATGDNYVHTTLNNVEGDYYFYVFASGKGIAIAGSDKITITNNKNCVFMLNNHSGTTAISATGNAEIDLGTGSSLNVYTNGDIGIAGNGLANNEQAKQMFFWGTNPTSQSITVSGNGQLTAVVYAPTASVTLNGGGTNGKVLGSVVAKSITMNGGSEFYYDESLSNLTTGNPYGISKWRELQSATDRATYTTQLNF